MTPHARRRMQGIVEAARSLVRPKRAVRSPRRRLRRMDVDVPEPVPRALDVQGPFVAMDADTGLVSVDVDLVVPRAFDEVKYMLDPQNWDLGGKHFYPDGTYLAADDPADPERCAHCGAVCTVPPGPSLPAGSDYPYRLLYEHFHGSDPGGFDVAFDNLLWVNPDILKTHDGHPKYVVTYSLHASLCGRVDFVSGVRFVRDDGEVSAVDEGHSRTRIHMRKNIRFDSQWANLTTYIAYRYEGRAVADDLADVAQAPMP